MSDASRLPDPWAEPVWAANLARKTKGSSGQLPVAQVRAHGRVQPDLTDRIEAAIEKTEPEAGRTYRELAQIVYELGEGRPTKSQLSAVRRSVAGLVKDGRAERGRNRHPRGSRGRGEVEVHRPLTQAELEAKRQTREAVARALQDRIEARRQATSYPIDVGYGGTVEVLVEPVLIIGEDEVELREAAA